jgi:uncharacterized membrane protein
MIEIQQLTKKELKGLRSKARTSIIALPIVMAIATFFVWLFDYYWGAFLVWTIIITIIFCFLYLNTGKEAIDADIKEGVKLMRFGKIKEVKVEKSKSLNTQLKFVTIVLEEEPIPDPYPEIHHFDIYNNLMQLYHERDKSLPGRYNELKGQTVVIEYFPYSGQVLSFEE